MYYAKKLPKENTLLVVDEERCTTTAFVQARSHQ